MNNYEPELGQHVFGQPYKTYQASNLLIAALEAIGEELHRVMGNIHQEDFSSPFSNTGDSFKEIEEFQVDAYSWNEEYEQPWNFKWKDIEVSWYKYLGRGTSVNRDISASEISTMLDACIDALQKHESDSGVFDFG